MKILMLLPGPLFFQLSSSLWSFETSESDFRILSAPGVNPRCAYVLHLVGAVILNQFRIVKCAALLVGLSTILALEFLLVQLDFCCQSLFSNNFFQIRVRLVLDMVFFVAQLSLSLNFKKIF